MNTHASISHSLLILFIVFLQTTTGACLPAHSCPHDFHAHPFSQVSDGAQGFPPWPLCFCCCAILKTWHYYNQNTTPFSHGFHFFISIFHIFYKECTNQQWWRIVTMIYFKVTYWHFYLYFGKKIPSLRSDSRVDVIITIANPADEVLVDREAIHMNIFREENFSLLS